MQCDRRMTQKFASEGAWQGPEEQRRKQRPCVLWVGSLAKSKLANSYSISQLQSSLRQKNRKGTGRANCGGEGNGRECGSDGASDEEKEGLNYTGTTELQNRGNWASWWTSFKVFLRVRTSSWSLGLSAGSLTLAEGNSISIPLVMWHHMIAS